MRKTFDATVKPVASRNNKKREKKRDDKAKEAAKKPQGPAASVFEKDRETNNRIKKDSELGKRRKEITDMKEIKVEKKQWVHKKKFDAAKMEESSTRIARERRVVALINVVAVEVAVDAVVAVVVVAVVAVVTVVAVVVAVVAVVDAVVDAKVDLKVVLETEMYARATGTPAMFTGGR